MGDERKAALRPSRKERNSGCGMGHGRVERVGE
jgi:hypothetical protein